MGSENKLLYVLAAVIIHRKITTKKKKKHTRYGFRRFAEKDRNMAYHI